MGWRKGDPFLEWGSCLAGFFIGRQFGGLLKERAEIFGGVILILTGIKIWLEHTVG